MNSIVLIFGGLLSASLAVMAQHLRQAPCGYEDQTGFHLGKLPFTPQAPTVSPTESAVASDAHPSGLRECAPLNPVERPEPDTKTVKFRSADEILQAPKEKFNHAA